MEKMDPAGKKIGKNQQIKRHATLTSKHMDFFAIGAWERRASEACG